MKTVVLFGGKIFTGRTLETQTNSVVIIKNRKIFKITGKRVDEKQLRQLYSDAHFYVLKDHEVILPGLIDCHIHIGLQGKPNTFDENFVEDKLRAIRAAAVMEKTLLAGYTTVRNAGSVNWIDMSVKDAVEKGDVIGPNILTTGKILSITAQGAEYFEGLYEEADGYDGFRYAARKQLKKGADLLKIMATGAIMNPGSVPGAVQPDEEEIRAAVREAKKLNKRVAAHAHGAEGMKNAIRAGVDTIEHGTFADKEAHRMMKDKGIYLIPTLSPGYFMNKYGEEGGVASFMMKMIKKRRQSRIDSTRKALDRGVKVACGSDAGTPFNYHRNNANEARLFVKLGLMTPAEALIADTRDSADACGLLDQVGTVEEGKNADLLVVEGDPTKNIEILSDSHNVKMVIRKGQIIKNEREQPLAFPEEITTPHLIKNTEG